MTTNQIKFLLAKARYLSLQHTTTKLFYTQQSEKAILKKSRETFLNFDALEQSIPRRVPRGVFFDDVLAICDECDPRDLARFPRQFLAVWEEFELIFQLTPPFSTFRTPGRLTREASDTIAYLQIQANNINTRYDYLVANRIVVNRDDYLQIADEVHTAQLVLVGRLRRRQQSISFEQKEYYIKYLLDTCEGPENDFLRNIRKLRSHLFHLLKANTRLSPKPLSS